MKTILLASRSPRRQDMLRESGFLFRVDAVDTDEHAPAGLSAGETALHIARGKAVASQRLRAPGEILIAADTVVSTGKVILGKPRDESEARDMLRSLSGRTHQVVTAVVISGEGGQEEFLEFTEVDFSPLSEETIAYYIQSRKPFDKAGAYAIQEWIGMTHIRAIRGCYQNVVGLPMPRLYAMLIQHGAARMPGH